MSVIRYRHDGRRIILPIVILSPEADRLQWVDAVALVDTGATTSGVTSALAGQLGLKVVGKRPLATAHEDAQVERYLFRIGLFPDREDSEAPQMPFVFEAVEGFCIRPGFRFNALLGMDFLSQCDLAIDRLRRCTLTFG